MGDTDIFGSMGRTDCEGATSVSPLAEERAAALFETHRDKIFCFLVGQGIEPAEAQELTQDVFFKLFVALRKGSEIESEQAWLYRVASRLAVDHWRREGSPMWVELESMPAFAESLRSQELTPEAAALRAQRLNRVATALAHLPKDQRLGIHLRMQGLRYRDIARILNLSVTTVSSLLSTAVERLRSAANE